MRRFEEIKRLDKKTRNKLRAILSNDENNAIINLAKLRAKLSSKQSESLDVILNSNYITKATRSSSPFPKKPPFTDTYQVRNQLSLNKILNIIEANIIAFEDQINDVVSNIYLIDEAYANKDIELCRNLIIDGINKNGWSHAILRRIVLLRENAIEDKDDEKIDLLVQQAGIKETAVASLIHVFSHDQNILTIKRSILNISDRGAINRYSKAISRLPVQPLAKSIDDLTAFLSEVEKCSLIDAIILAKFNSHLFVLSNYPAIEAITKKLGRSELFERLIETYDAFDSDSEYAFFKQSSAWLEYEPIKQYRLLVDTYYDASLEEVESLPNSLFEIVQNWVSDVKLKDLVGKTVYTNHPYKSLAKLELSGTVTRSAIFNYWLHTSEGQIGFETADLLTLMGITRDLARTIPIKAVRTAAKLSKENLVRLILLLLLGKRSKNEWDSFLLRKILEDIATTSHNGSLVDLVKAYEITHPKIAEYIYEIATEDFLAKLNKLAPHRADIPEIRASLHEWMAEFTKDDYFLQRARAVRIDHQLNRVRNEIDDHRIYVDPSRFSSWIEDEMMMELNNALSSTGSEKKGISVNCDETILFFSMKQCYSAFCSNSVFGIASYIGRRIRHGTFHGHLFSSVINPIEKNEKFQPLFRNAQFDSKWSTWKDLYNNVINGIITDRLHIYSKAGKPLGLLQPESYGPAKLEILSAAVKSISTAYTETTSVSGVDQTIIDYCWRLAEIDLLMVTKYFRAQQTPLKNLKFLTEEVLPTALPADRRLADAFLRELELSIDRKITSMIGWFKRPSIVAPQASLSLLFAATVSEVRDTITDFNPQEFDTSEEEIELVGGVYHLVYDSLAVVVANAAKHGDRTRPVKRKFKIVSDKHKQLIVEISSSINPTESPEEVARVIEHRKKANFHDANLYQGKSGISKLMLLANTRKDFMLEQYEVVGNEVKVRLAYALEH
jgi:hypothetical protein